MKRKLLAAFACLLAFSLFAGAAPAETVDSGTCGAEGAEIIWTLEEQEGGSLLLSIAGTGAMADYEESDAVPWHSNGTQIARVTIGDGVTSIGSHAFHGCENLTTVTIPAGVTGIGNNAFQYCESLATVTIPGGVKRIGDSAFQCCESLTSVTISEGVESIGYAAFESCGLEKVIIPKSVTDIAENAFNSQGLVLAYYAGDEAGWGRVNKAAGWYPTSRDDFEVVFLSGACGDSVAWSLEALDGEAFLLSISGAGAMADYGTGSMGNPPPWYGFCEQIARAEIGEGVTAIGSHAFSGCANLTTVTIPASVTGIGAYAFAGCARLDSIRYQGDEAGWNAIDKSEGWNENTPENLEVVFVGGRCGDGVAWAIGELNDGSLLLSIHGTGAMADYSFASSQTNPPWYGFRGQIARAEIGEGVTSIGSYAFCDCKKMTGVAIPDGMIRIGDSAFSRSGLTEVAIPGGVASIGNRAFESCAYLNKATIPDSVTGIGDGAFYGSGLTEVTIPGGVTDMGYGVFSSSSNLTHVTICEGAADVGAAAFSSCGRLKAVAIPDSVTGIGDAAFFQCTSLEQIWYAGDEAGWNAIDKGEGWNENTPENLEVVFVRKEMQNGLVLPKGLLMVGADAFAGAESVRAVYLPDGFLVVGENAFADCESLIALRIPNSLDAVTLKIAGLPETLLLFGPAGGAAEEIAANYAGWSFMAE